VRMKEKLEIVVEGCVGLIGERRREEIDGGE
jgi:hypothetical protein